MNHYLFQLNLFYSFEQKEVGIMYSTCYWAPNFPALFWILPTKDEIGDILFLLYLFLFLSLFHLFLFYSYSAIFCCDFSEPKVFKVVPYSFMTAHALMIVVVVVICSNLRALT